MRCTICTFAIAGVLAVISGLALFAKAADPTTKPSSGVRLFSPYSKLNSLTDDQRMKIREIHVKTLADIKKIDAQEEMDINALLTDDQKKELAQLEDKASADRKSKNAGKKSEDDMKEKDDMQGK